MQRIKTSRWPVRNIGGDRAFCKLRYVKGSQFDIPNGATSLVQFQVMNVGAYSGAANLLQSFTLNGVMGETPNLSTMGALYTRYRIRGIKIRLTYWQQGGDPVILFTNAQPDRTNLGVAVTGPDPAFITPNVTTTTEQRWAKYRVCQATATGGRATSLSAYYSVNKVQGPDSIVRNDRDYTGEMMATTPYWANTSGVGDQPLFSPWLQFGVSTLTGAVAPAGTQGVLKVEQTVYCEFFGKRVQTQ